VSSNGMVSQPTLPDDVDRDIPRRVNIATRCSTTWRSC